MENTTKILSTTYTTSGASLNDLSMEHPLLVVFLRHFRSVFCKEALSELSKKNASLDLKGIKLIFVHMSNYDTAKDYFDQYNFSSYYDVADPNCEIYEKFGLTKGSFGQLFGLTVMIRGVQANLQGNNWSLKQIGDGFQMPGIFLIHQGKIEESFIHNKVSDKPDYDNLISCCVS